MSTENCTQTTTMDSAIDDPLHAVRVATSLCALSLILWALYRRLSRPCDISQTGPVEGLSNIPGPPAPSFIQGSLGDLYSLDGWDYQRKIGEKCECLITVCCHASAMTRLTTASLDGSAIKIKGPFGVCPDSLIFTRIYHH